jgi:hypothetical protein
MPTSAKSAFLKSSSSDIRYDRSRRERVAACGEDLWLSALTRHSKLERADVDAAQGILEGMAGPRAPCLLCRSRPGSWSRDSLNNNPLSISLRTAGPETELGPAAAVTRHPVFCAFLCEPRAISPQCGRCIACSLRLYVLLALGGCALIDCRPSSARRCALARARGENFACAIRRHACRRCD